MRDDAQTSLRRLPGLSPPPQRREPAAAVRADAGSRAGKHRPFLYLALVALIFFAGDRAGAWLLDRAVAASDFRFARMYRGGLDNDVLVIGDSRAVHSIYAPELSAKLCRSVFNAGFNGMSGEIAKAVVEDYLDHNKPPKAVLIEVSDAADDTDLIKEMRLFGRSPGHLHDLVRRLDPWERVWSAISHLYAFDNELTLRSLYYLRHGDQDWIMYDRPMTPDVIAAIPRDRYAQWHIRPESREALRQLAEELEARHIAPVLYIAPFHPAFHKLVPQYEAWVHDFQRELGPGLPIIDLSSRFSDNDYFSDIVHTNLRGSRVVMDVLAQRLRQMLPPDTARACPLGSAPAAAAAAGHAPG